MASRTICEAQYKYGNLVYIVSIVEEQSDVDWETEREIIDNRYFVEYTEKTLPSKNRVGGFESLDEALDWAGSQFGQLRWSFFSNRP